MKRQTTISFLCLLLTAFLAITLTGCPVTPRGTGPEGEAVDEGEAVRVGGRVQEGEGETVQPTEGEGETVQPTEGETVMLPGNVPLEMVWIPAGTFMMGAHEGEQDGYDSEYPQHQVTLTSGFRMGKYEVTQAQWKAVMNDNPSDFQGENTEGETNTDNRPVEDVSS